MTVSSFVWILFLSLGGAGSEGSQAISLRILELCNQARQEAGVPPLVLDSKLEGAAIQHSVEMDQLKYFGHVSPIQEHRTLALRIKQAGNYQLTSAENLHREQGATAATIAEETVKAWLVSPVHRKNILNSSYNRVGIGVHQVGDQFTVTQDLVYSAVNVLDKRVSPKTDGYQVEMDCEVNDGPREGALIYDGKRVGNWVADSSGKFKVDITVPGPGSVAIGQSDGTRSWTIETEVPVQ